MIAVAGGAGNLGPTVVRRLAEEGAKVCVCGRDRESLDALADELGVEIETDVVDLLDPAATKRWADELAGTARRPCRRPRPPRRRLARRNPDRGGPARGLGCAEPAPRANGAACDTGVRATPAGQRARPVRPRVLGAGRSPRPTRTRSMPQRRPRRRRGRSRSQTASRASGATANVVVVGAILTPAMRAESPGKDFAGFTPAEEIADAIAYLSARTRPRR